MKTKLLITITLLAAILRFYHNSANPPGLFLDELSNGYNAYSILKTGRDEYGNFLPLVFKSFGDYNPALSVYTLVPSIAVFGLNEISVRFPSAFLGTISTLLVYAIVKKFFDSKKIALASAFFLAVLPWSIHFSRYDHEANIMLFFTLLGLYLFLNTKNRIIWLTASAIAFGLAFNSYQGAKIWIPVFLINLVIWYRTEFKKFGFKKAAMCFFILSLFLLPAVLNFRTTLIRGQSVGIFQSNNKIEQFISGYLKHYSLNFLFVSGDSIGRHAVEGIGELYVFLLPLIILGLKDLLTKSKSRGEKLLLSWFVLAPIPAALAVPTPHALRSLQLVPVFSIIAAYGLHRLSTWKDNYYKKLSFLAIFLIGLYNLVSYFHLYYVHYPKLKEIDWSYGYKQMVEYVNSVKGQYSTIAISSYYGWPYIAVLFYSVYDPAGYQPQSQDKTRFDKFEFFNESWGKTRDGKALVVTPEWQGHPPKILKEIYYQNGDVAFRISEEE